MKRYLLLLLFAALCIGVNAQNNVPHYQGEINVGYGIGIGDYQVDRFYVETIHGARIIPHLFLGAGAGLALLNGGHVTIPVFANVKDTLQKVKFRRIFLLILDTDLGTKKGFMEQGV